MGTLAEIREATRYPDGRFHLLTLGTSRFRLEGVDPATEPYLVGQVTPLGEVLGEAGRARQLGKRVAGVFVRYLELLQVDERSPRSRRSASSATEGLAAALTTEAAGPAWATDEDDSADASVDAVAAALDAESHETTDGPTPSDARRLTIPDDPTVLSHLLSGIVQVEPIRRQVLLETPTTELRLAELAHLLEREIALLERGLGTYAPDPRLTSLRRN